MPNKNARLSGHFCFNLIQMGSMETVMKLNVIPAMTDPLGRYWEQPGGMRQAPMDDTHVLLSTEQVKQLKEYSGSIPSGKYDGKCWKRKNGAGWALCWYYPHAKPNRISIGDRIILEIE